MQMERETWRENGLAPPLPGTDAEKHWAEVDKAVTYTKVCLCFEQSQCSDSVHVIKLQSHVYSIMFADFNKFSDQGYVTYTSLL